MMMMMKNAVIISKGIVKPSSPTLHRFRNLKLSFLDQIATHAVIISKGIVKPSSPTPHHLRNLKLSFLDQIATPIYFPIILFYDHSSHQITDPSEISTRLQKSLADTLPRYYPLAGTLKEDSWVDCDDVGVQYYEYKLTCKLSQIIKNDPNPKELQHFLPFEPYCNERSGVAREVLLAVKSTFFECGGLAIGMCVSHKISDGTSIFTFLNDWAATCLRGDYDDDEVAAAYPIFDAASHFPPRDVQGFKLNISSNDTTKDNIVTKRFLFDNSKIMALKEEATGSDVKNPTRVEAVSAFIWQRFMAIPRSKQLTTHQQAKVFAAAHIVNLRPRMDPPLSMHSYGNLWWPAMIIAPSSIVDADHEKKEDHEYRSLVSQMRNALRKVDSEYVKMLQSGDGQMNVIKNLTEKFSRGEIELCGFTSWCRFPVYEVDFGWGKPTWVFSSVSAVKNMVMLMSTKDGDGIEAWVNLVDEDMDLFERDAKLLSYVSSPASIGG